MNTDKNSAPVRAATAPAAITPNARVLIATIAVVGAALVVVERLADVSVRTSITIGALVTAFGVVLAAVLGAARSAPSTAKPPRRPPPDGPVRGGRRRVPPAPRGRRPG